MNKTALIVGVGEATGQAICRAWAEEFKLIMVARSPNLIAKLEAELPNASAYQCDVADRDEWQSCLQQILAEHGQPDRILINTECAAWGEYHELSLAQLDLSFDVNVVSVLQLVQVLFPSKGDIPSGTRLMISSSPAAYNPPARFLGLAPSRVAQRVLAELLHANLSDAGLAFSVFSINGAINEPNMRSVYADKPDSFFIEPSDIAADMDQVFSSNEFPLAAEIRGESAFA